MQQKADEPPEKPTLARSQLHTWRFDTKQALEKLGNNEHLYHQLLLSFAQSQRFTSQRLTEALELRNFEQVKCIAHTVKGHAGSIGTRAFSKSAVELESTAKEGLVDQRGDEFKLELQRTLDIISRVTN